MYMYMKCMVSVFFNNYDRQYMNFMQCNFFICIRALEAFHKVLLLAPDFARLNEVHVRMGLMLKREGHFQDALKVNACIYMYMNLHM